MLVETVQLFESDVQSVPLLRGHISTVDHATDSLLCQQRSDQSDASLQSLVLSEESSRWLTFSSVRAVRRRPLAGLRSADPVVSIWCSWRFTEARDRYFSQENQPLIFKHRIFFNLEHFDYTSVFFWQHFVSRFGNAKLWQKRKSLKRNVTTDFHEILCCRPK